MFDGYKTRNLVAWQKQGLSSDLNYNLDQPGVVPGEQRAINRFLCPPFT